MANYTAPWVFSVSTTSQEKLLVSPCLPSGNRMCLLKLCIPCRPRPKISFPSARFQTPHCVLHTHNYNQQDVSRKDTSHEPPLPSFESFDSSATSFRETSVEENPHAFRQESGNGVVLKAAELTPVTSTLVLMRHGESMWNSLELFTGDVDIPLTEQGVMEALAGGLAVAHIDFDMIFTSRLVRSKQTALMAMTQSLRKVVPVIVRGGFHGKGTTGDENRLRLRAAAAQALQQATCRMIPVYADKDLNERCYGDLQGLSKEAAVLEFGAEMVQLWRRSHDTHPPNGESLMDTWGRAVGFFESTIIPQLKEGKSVLVVAHGNVLRCIISHLGGLTVDEMLRLQVVTALPYAYSYTEGGFAQCCVLPPLDPRTNQPGSNAHRGLTSVLKKQAEGGEHADSLI